MKSLTAICGKKMEHVKDADQPHIGYEICREHGMYFERVHTLKIIHFGKR